ncbi:MAG: hypothetical protein L0206_14565 [Actinobacteria bacterium]|nr:hypothetical protein [Actinomycetota bacterium]
MYDQPSYVWALVMIGVLGIPAVTSWALFQGAIAAGTRRRTAWLVGGGAAYLFAAWIVASTILASTGVYQGDPGKVAPWFGIAVAGALTAFLMATRIPLVSRILDEPGMLARLAIANVFRVVGVSFLIAMALGDLPWVFALPAGLGDIAAGIAAPFVARKLSRGQGYRDAVRFHWYGIGDLVLALTIGFFAGLGPWLLIDIAPTTEALALLPLALVPTTAVPLTITLHIVSLQRLRAVTRRERSGGDRSGRLHAIPSATDRAPLQTRTARLG